MYRNEHSELLIKQYCFQERGYETAPMASCSLYRTVLQISKPNGSPNPAACLSQKATPLTLKLVDPILSFYHQRSYLTPAPDSTPT